LEREWIKVSGFRDVPGRPALYVTTKQFLDDFNMKSISSLPELPEPVEHNNEELLSEVV
jgi:segregation and condensation protein B